MPPIGAMTTVEAFTALEQAARSGRMSADVLLAFHSLSRLGRTDHPLLEVARRVADKALFLEGEGYETTAEVRHLLRVREEFQGGRFPTKPTAGTLWAYNHRLGTDPFDLATVAPTTTFQIPGGRELDLFVPKTVWKPGVWSQVLANVLFDPLQRPLFEGREAIELGVGSGVLSLGMLLAGARRVIGVDLIADAILAAGINMIHNLPEALQGRLALQVSDVLDSLESSVKVDLIVGCLPQVVGDPTRQRTERDRGDVYFGTGEIEDRYGLGLLSRALRGSLVHLRPEGRVLFTVAGRPGREVILELFRRQGFHPTILSRTRIPQDPNPPMETFAQMEQRGGVSFEFFLGDGTDPISAGTALDSPRDQITHDLFVIQGEPMRDIERRSFVEILRPDGSGHDAGYTERPGRELAELRERLAARYRFETGIEVNPKRVFIGPSAQELLVNILRASTNPKGRILFTTRNWHRFEEARETLTDRNREAIGETFAEIEAAIRRKKPAVVVLNITLTDRNNEAGLVRILQAALRHDTKIILAGLYGRRPSSGEYLLARALRQVEACLDHLVVLNDLTARDHLQRGNLSMAIIPNKALYRAVADLGEVTYSRVSTVAQRAAARFLEETVGEPRPATYSMARVRGSPTDFNRHLREWIRSPSYLRYARSGHADPIDWSFGESEWPMPEVIREAMRAAAENPRRGSLEEEAIDAARRYLQESRGIRAPHLIGGPGLLPLQADLIRAIARLTGQKPTVLLPAVHYDIHSPVILAVGGESVKVAVGKNTKIDPASLRRAVAEAHGPVILLLTQPTNPGGQYYSREELAALAQASPNVLLFSDEVFGLTHGDGMTFASPAALPASGPHWESVVTGFGISKEFGHVAGIRAGFLASDQGSIIDRVRRERLTAIDPIAQAAATAAFGAWQALTAGHREFLSGQRTQLERFLGEVGIPYLPSEGGFGTLADLSVLSGRSFRGEPITLRGRQGLLDRAVGLGIKPPRWGGTNQSRLVYSIRRLPEAIDRFRGFLSEIG